MKKPRISESSKQIIMFIAEGHSDKEIADKMEMPVRTVQDRIARLRKVFDVPNRTALALKFIMFNIGSFAANKTA